MLVLKQPEIGFKLEMEYTLKRESEARVDGYIEALSWRKPVMPRTLGMYWR